MSNIREEMLLGLNTGHLFIDECILHYGVGHDKGGHSGRYPFGSGEDPKQHGSQDFCDRVDDLRKSGMKEADIAKAVGLQTTTELRLEYAITKNERKQATLGRILELKEQGLSNPEIAKEVGLPNESSVRSYLNQRTQQRMKMATTTAETIKETVDKSEYGMVDVGAGVERELGVSRTKMNEALYLLKREGYNVYGGGLPQATNPGRQTNLQVLCKPGIEHKEIFDPDKVSPFNSEYKIIQDDSGNDTLVPNHFVYPASLDSSRLAVRVGQEGVERDGTCEIRPGVTDLSLGDSRYSQVRILVDGKHYVKGMAVYGKEEDFPPGVDLIVNSSKNYPPDRLDKHLKPIKEGENPFGANIKQNGGQSYYFDENGEKHLSLINKRSDQGDWTEWDDTLPAQFLSKQDPSLAKKQTDLALQYKKTEFDEIMSIENPTIRKKQLNAFAGECDSKALHLDAAALPRQKWHAILPIPEMKDNEIYAPQYQNGEKVALVRYPHEGTYQIPILTVNNKVAEGKRKIGADAIDAVGINAKVAERLSGADFDGDTVMIIPTHDKYGNVKINNKEPLKGLEGFDNKLEYYQEPIGKDSDGNDVYPYKTMKKGSVGKEMGVISNLITDMTLKGATDDELARATRHAMVVIDAHKHHLDYRKSEKDNGIAQLKKKYQGHIGEDGRYHEGAGTIVSRAKSQQSVPERSGQPHVNIKGSKWYDPTRPEGAILYNESGRTKTKTYKDGTTVEELKKVRSTKMMETDDATTLVFDKSNQMEMVYANYANGMKSMANEARKEAMLTPNLKYDRDATKTYEKQVKSLDAKLAECEMNAPREREAQRLTNNYIKNLKDGDPTLTKKEIKKESQQALTKYRAQVGASRKTIVFTDDEWEAINKGAITDSKFTKILKYTDGQHLRERTMPKTMATVTDAQAARMKTLANNNYTYAEIAQQMGVSVSTVRRYIEGK